MSADVLRRAAALMRERAEGAIENLHGSRDWTGIGTGYREPIKEHIAGVSPVVALAIADLIEAATCVCPTCDCCGISPTCAGCEPITAALAVARAYLGES